MGNLISGKLKHSRTTSSDDEPPNKRRNLGQSAVGIGDLPDEMVCTILCYLSSMELINNAQHVCRRWKRLSHDPELWLGRRICIGGSCSEEEAVTALRNMPQVRFLVLHNLVRPLVLEAISTTCPRITTLSILRCYQITRSLLESLVVKCQNIQTLTVPDKLLFDERNTEMLSQLSKLQSLAVEAQNITTEKHIHVKPLGDGCPVLEELNINVVDKLHVRGLSYFLNVKCCTLTGVTLPWAVYSRNHRRCVLPLLEDCRALRYLKLSHCHLVNDEESEVFPLLGRLSSLRTLKLCSLKGCSEESARPFESGELSGLRMLNIHSSDLPDYVVQAICTHCAELTSLTLMACSDITDDSLKDLSLLTRLNKLSLGACPFLRGEAISHVSQLSTLRDLHLHSFSVTLLQPGLERIAELTSLKQLSMSFSNLRLFPFHRLLARLIQLRVLELECCEVQGAVLDSLRRLMPHLRIGRGAHDDWEVVGEDKVLDSPQESDAGGEDWDWGFFIDQKYRFCTNK